MKRLTLLILILIPSLSLLGQQFGDGSIGNPYYGNVTGTITWAAGRTIYVGQSGNQTRNDLTVAGTLIIQPGVKVIFTQSASDLRINATGALRATGTNSGKITFTSSSPSNIWGHIAFINSTPASNLTYCIIENGTATNRELYKGGGIYANSNNLTISNCIIRKNTADACGGGIYTSLSPKIENCLIIENECYGYQAGEGGGGIFLDTGSSATVTNCTIAENIVWDIDNLAFGDDVYSASATAIMKNSIIWRSSVNLIQIYFTFSPSSSNLTNCAIVGAYNNNRSDITSTFTSGIVLNVDNTAIDGPNFLNPVTELTITPISPCRDRGTSASSPGAVPPPVDFTGNARVGPYDIGAYEVLYTRWRTDAATTDWNTAANWSGGVPSSISSAVIPTGAVNYPVLTPAPDFTVGSGRYLIIEPGACTTLNSLTNNGTVELLNSATASASLILGTYTRGTGGTEKIQVVLTGGGTEDEDNFKWHFISAPVSSLPVSTFTGATQDLAQYVESRTQLSLAQGWVAYDGYIYASGANNGPSFSSLTPGKGYDFWDGTDNTFSFSGLLNTSTVNVALSYTLPQVSAPRGFNLLGNPFHSGLNWDYMINDASYPANTSKALYFTRDNVQCTYAGGVGIPGDVNGIIPPMQGFFNKTNVAGNTLSLSASARTHSNIHSRYKKGDEVIPLIRLAITEKNLTDETVIRFNENAKPDLDLDFDAIKMFTYKSQPFLYSAIAGTNYAINGQPFPEEEGEFPIVVNVPTDGSHKITAKQITGLDSYYITLTDKITGYSAELKKVPWLSFIASAGTISDRFVLKISTSPTGIEDPLLKDKSFLIYQTDNFIFIQPLSDTWQGKKGSVRLIDLTGKRLTEISNVEFNINSVLQVEAPGKTGIYVVEIQSGSLRYKGKLLIN